MFVPFFVTALIVAPMKLLFFTSKAEFTTCMFLS